MKVINCVKEEFKELKTVKVFSDGCASQFKNRYNLSNLCFFLDDFELIGEWHFLATSHGKGAVVGVGGEVPP